jgi:cell division septal protein FtsQ
VSISDRKSGSSGPSKRRKSVYISTAQSDRANRNARRLGGSAPADASRGARVEGARPRTRAQVQAQERKTERERRTRAERTAVRLRIGGTVAALVAVVVACGLLYRAPVFTVRRIEVVGATHLSAARVRALAQVPEDATLIRFPADEVAQRVARDPWVESADVTRVFPDGMRIRVTERRPVALVDAGKVFWLIDGGGFVIAQRSTEDTASMPVIRDVPGLDLKAGRKTTSEPLLNAVRVLTGMSPEIASTVNAISAATIDGTTLFTRDRVEIVVGEATDLVTKDSLARQILQQQSGKVVSIDVRNVDYPTSRGLK